MNTVADEQIGQAAVRLMNAALVALPAPIVVVARDGRVSLCNPAAAALLGVERSAIERRPIDTLLGSLELLDAATADGRRSVLPWELSDGACRRIGVRVGHARTFRLLVLDQAPEPVPADAERSPFDVVELLQLAALSRRSMVLDVTVDDGHCGRIIVVHGAPWWARDVLGDGKAALQRLLFRRCEETACTPLASPPPERNLEGLLDELLLNAARVRDEEQRAPAEIDLDW